MTKEIRAYIDKNCEMYNRHMSTSEIEEIYQTYMTTYKEYNEPNLITHIEFFHNEKNERNRTPAEVEAAKNWRSQRRASVCSERFYSNDFSDVSFPKTKETFQFLSDVLVADIPFGLMNPNQKNKLIDIIQCIDIEKGVTLIKEGDKGSTMYLVEDGIFDVYIKNVKINELRRGAVFGEIALLHNISRTATVISQVKSKIWVIEQNMFQGLRLFDREKNKEIVTKGIKALNLYPDLDEREIKSFVSTLSFDYCKEGKVVEVNSDEVFYFTQDGIIENEGKRQVVKQKEIIRNSFTCISVIEGTVMKTRQRKLYY